MHRYSRVLITGAAGSLGGELRKCEPRLAPHVRLTDLHSVTGPASHEEDAPCDLADFDGVMAAMAGCDAVVHLGAKSTEGGWQEVLQSNIVGTYNIFEAARRCGVKRIVYASSIHAVGYYERNQTIDAAAPMKPDSLYGVSKTFGENLASFYFDKFGIESVCLRIGSCYPEPADRRHLITWLSFRDFRQLVQRCLSAPRVGHLISYATSNNDQSFWDNRLASILGYKPQDNAEDYRGKVFAKIEQGDPNDPAVRFQGGSFCAMGHLDTP
jgi:uronate dehydrogenase